MEWIASFFLTLLVIATIAQLFWAYSLSAIAEKGGQGDLMQVLAWIPILQIAPMIVAGGGSVPGFLIGCVGLLIGSLVLGATSALVGGSVGTAIAGLGFGFVLLLSLFYFGRIAWTTATERELPGIVGLLVFVPIANFFVYPYIAFHDGWSAPNKIGLVIGLVLAIGSTVPSFRVISMMKQEGGFPIDLATLWGDAQIADPAQLETFELALKEAMRTPQEDASNPIGHEDSIRALFTLQGRFQSLENQTTGTALRDPEQQQMAMDLVRSIDVELRSHRDSLDAQTYRDLATHLVEIESLIQDASGAVAKPSSGSALISRPHDATRSSDRAGPAALAHFSKETVAPVRPLPVHPQDGCPEGTEMRTRQHPDAEEEWCRQLDHLGGLRHGWYARYGEGGQPESMGEYRDGLKVGIWTRFYPTGEVRAQAQFKKGLQHGWLLSFDQEGHRTKALRFDQGAALR